MVRDPSRVPGRNHPKWDRGSVHRHTQRPSGTEFGERCCGLVKKRPKMAILVQNSLSRETKVTFHGLADWLHKWGDVTPIWEMKEKGT